MDSNNLEGKQEGATRVGALAMDSLSLSRISLLILIGMDSKAFFGKLGG